MHFYPYTYSKFYSNCEASYAQALIVCLKFVLSSYLTFISSTAYQDSFGLIYQSGLYEFPLLQLHAMIHESIKVLRRVFALWGFLKNLKFKI